MPLRKAPLGMIQRFQRLPIPLRILAYAGAAAALLGLAAGVGVIAALTLGPDGDSPQGAKPERVGEVKPKEASPEQDGRSKEDTKARASDASSEDTYLSSVDSIQNRSVEATLRSNDKLLRYDALTADDVEEIKANYVALKGYVHRAKDLAPAAAHEDQYRVFVLALSELRAADGLAYHLAANPSSATQTDFEAYDRHVDRATAYLKRSNELLGKDYKTTRAAQEVSLG